MLRRTLLTFRSHCTERCVMRNQFNMPLGTVRVHGHKRLNAAHHLIARIHRRRPGSNDIYSGARRVMCNFRACNQRANSKQPTDFDRDAAKAVCVSLCSTSVAVFGKCSAVNWAGDTGVVPAGHRKYNITEHVSCHRSATTLST